jgi:hypothetical protein
LKLLFNQGKKCSLNFQVILKRRNNSANSNYDEYELNDNPDENENDDEEDEDDEDENDDDDSRTSSEEENTVYNENDDTDRNSLDYTGYLNLDYTDEEWYAYNSGVGNPESDDEKYRKSSSRLHQIQIFLDSMEKSPYLAINNQKMLKWKFNRRDDDFVTDSCSFKIYSTFSKNFESAYYLLDELIDQLNLTNYTGLNELWTCLVRIGCVQTFGKRLKIFSLLIKIMYKIDLEGGEKSCINLHALKPLKNLQYYLQNSSSHNNSRNLCRALFELFFFAEKLAIKWEMQKEYRAHMRDKEEFVEQVCETSYFIKLMMKSLNLNDEVAVCDNETNENAEKESKRKQRLKVSEKFELALKKSDGSSKSESDEPTLFKNSPNETKNECTLDNSGLSTSRESCHETNENNSNDYETETDEDKDDGVENENESEDNEENEWSN